jgi:uncharacterized protein DUF4112
MSHGRRDLAHRLQSQTLMSELVPLPPEEPKVRIIVPGSKPPPSGDERERMRTAVRHLAWLLDSAFEIPGTKFRIGLDPILGLIPVVGDLIAMAIGGYIIMIAARLGVPRAVLVRMLMNLGTDALVGSVPVAGDVLDAAWRANAKNARLLDQALTDPKAAGRSSIWMLVLIGAVVLVIGVGGILLTVWLVRLLVGST